MKPKNLKEFKALIKRYESITLEEIKQAFRENEDDVAKKLTGYGCDTTCALCLAISKDCDKCVYSANKELGYQCLRGKNKKTFDRIENANTPRKLLNAFRARAKHMKTLI